jgi:hypothetical protein
MDFEQHLYKIDHDIIQQVDYAEFSGISTSKYNYWLILKAESREPVAKELKKLGFDSGILSEISVPGNSKNVMISDHSLIINLVIPKPSAWYERDYITIIMNPGLMITILKPEISLFD